MTQAIPMFWFWVGVLLMFGLIAMVRRSGWFLAVGAFLLLPVGSSLADKCYVIVEFDCGTEFGAIAGSLPVGHNDAYYGTSGWGSMLFFDGHYGPKFFATSISGIVMQSVQIDLQTFPDYYAGSTLLYKDHVGVSFPQVGHGTSARKLSCLIDFDNFGSKRVFLSIDNAQWVRVYEGIPENAVNTGQAGPVKYYSAPSSGSLEPHPMLGGIPIVSANAHSTLHKRGFVQVEWDDQEPVRATGDPTTAPSTQPTTQATSQPAGVGSSFTNMIADIHRAMAFAGDDRPPVLDTLDIGFGDMIPTEGSSDAWTDLNTAFDAIDWYGSGRVWIDGEGATDLVIGGVKVADASFYNWFNLRNCFESMQAAASKMILWTGAFLTWVRSLITAYICYCFLSWNIVYFMKCTGIINADEFHLPFAVGS